MELIITTGFGDVSKEKILFQPQTEVKGKKLVEAGHVINVKEYRSSGKSQKIVSEVVRQTSVGLPHYKTTLHIDSHRVIEKAECSCVYNKSGKCKHIAALVYFINHEESLTKTNCEQQWGKPSGKKMAMEKYSKGKNFCDLFPKKENTKKRKSCEALMDLSLLKEKSALSIIIKENDRDENERAAILVTNDLLVKVDEELARDTITSHLHSLFQLKDQCTKYSKFKVSTLGQQLLKFYNEEIVLSSAQIVNLCSATIKQSSNTQWFEARRLRLSASKNCHSIIKRKSKTIESLVLDMLHPKLVNNSAAVKHGLKYEKFARQQYEQLFNVKVIEVGVLVCKDQPWLCASLDGLVYQDSKIKKIVEFKCPYTCRKEAIIDFDLNQSKVAFLSVENNTVTLNKNNLYYTQVQIQMYVCGASICDLYVYSLVPGGSCCVQVMRDEPFLKEAVEKCEDFFYSNYLPALCSENAKENNSKNVSMPNKNVKTITFSGKDVSNVTN